MRGRGGEKKEGKETQDDEKDVPSPLMGEDEDEGKSQEGDFDCYKYVTHKNSSYIFREKT